jgi:hypothetical protein
MGGGDGVQNVVDGRKSPIEGPGYLRCLPATAMSTVPIRIGSLTSIRDIESVATTFRSGSIPTV